MTVTHLDDPLTGRGCLGIVRNHYDCLIESVVQFAKHVQDDFGIFRIEIASRLVREHDGGPINDCPGQRDTLLLAAGKLERLVMHLVLETQHAEYFAATIRIVCPVPLNAFGEAQISFRRQGGEEIEALKDETDLAPANVGPLCIGGGSQIFPIDDDTALRWGQQAAEQMQHGRLAASGWSHDADELAFLHGERNTAQGRHVDFANPVSLFKIVSF